MRYACTSDDSGISINLLVDGSYRLDVSGHPMTLEIESSVRDLALHCDVVIRSDTDQAVGLNVRVPTWAGHGEVFIGDELMGRGDAPGYLAVARRWHGGEVVTVKLPHLPVVTIGHRQGRQVLRQNEAAVRYGPHVYALSDLHNPNIDIHTARICIDEQGSATFDVIDGNRLRTIGVTLDGTETELIYSPIAETGGNPNGIGRSHPALASPFRVWIPIEGMPNAQ